MNGISVIIPTFNAARYVAEALESVQRQTLQPLEIVVVDDGSSDDTEEVVRRCAGAVPIFYHRTAHQGAANTRNLGVARAKGDWIAFLDADDIYYPEKLRVQFEQIQSHPDGVFFYSEFDVVQPNGSVVEKAAVSAFRPSNRDHWKKLSTITFRGQAFPIPSAVMLRKNVFTELGGFRPDMRGKYYEDFELFARIAEKFPIYFSAQKLVRYRLNPKSQREMHCTPNVSILLGSLWQLWREQPEKQALLVKHYAYHYSMLAKYTLQDGNYLLAREYYRTSFHYFPALYFPWHWKNLRRWAMCYLPGVRTLYRPGSARNRPAQQ